MDELIIRSLQGRTTAKEDERLRGWRARDAANERRYRTLRELWVLTGVAAPEPDEDLPDVDAIIARAEGERQTPTRDVTPIAAGRSGEPPDVQTGRSPSGWRRRIAVGAVAAGLVAVGLGIGAVLDGDGERRGMLSQSEIVTGAGEMTTVTLADGSSIRLGPESSLRLSEENGRRTAWLEGRAFFGIQADSARPFTVRTEDGEAHVLGTRFEVRARDDEFRVLVVQGSVSAVAGGEEVHISDGEMSRVAPGRRISTERIDDVYRQLDWIGNAIVFQATPLGQALDEIKRRYGVNIALEDPALAELTVTATFTDRPIEHVVFVICEIVNAACTLDDGRIRIGTGEVGATAHMDTP